MNLAEKIRLLLEWTPVLNHVISITSASNANDQVMRTLELLDYLSKRTPNPLDDEVVQKLRATINTPEGQQLLALVIRVATPLLSGVQ